MLTAGHFLIAFAILAAWIGSLWVHPFGKCPRSRGRRMVIKNGKRKPWPVQCRVCNGVGRRQRPGSRTVHRTVQHIRRELERQRKQRQAAASEES